MFGEQSAGDDVEGNSQPVQEIQGGDVALLQLNLADPSTGDTGVHRQSLMGKTARRPQKPKIPSQEFPTAHKGTGHC